MKVYVLHFGNRIGQPTTLSRCPSHKNEDGSYRYQVYRKKTHTDIYLHADSHHHPNQKIDIINTLTTRASRIADSEHMDKELDHLREAFIKNGYHRKIIENVIHQARKRKKSTHTVDIPKISLPYIKGTTNQIARMLRKQDIHVSILFLLLCGK